MRNRWLAGVFLVVLIVGGWLLMTREEAGSGNRRLETEPTTPVPAVNSAASEAAEPTATPEFAPERRALRVPEIEELSNLPPHPLAAEIGSGTVASEDGPAAVLEIFGAYRSAFGSYPSGESNPEIMRALRGGNPERRQIFDRDSPRLDSEGALLDGYGTPYFFHLISSQSLEVRSAGADRAFYTPDDIVAADRGPGASSSNE